MNQSPFAKSAQSIQNPSGGPLIMYRLKFPPDYAILGEANLIFRTNGESCDPTKEKIYFSDLHIRSPRGDKRNFINDRTKELDDTLIFSFENIDDIDDYPDNLVDCFKMCYDVCGWSSTYIEYHAKLFKITKAKPEGTRITRFSDIIPSIPIVIIKK
jgi:hypothetical protein